MKKSSIEKSEKILYIRAVKTRKKLRQIELLAPTKDLTCGIAAIKYGADAVYIGAPKFGARVAAGNSLDDIRRLIDYAHRYWAKVYITLNTILFDHELEEALNLIHLVYDAGADALIIQDMGLLELELPPIPLIASTQMHNYSLEQIQFLEKVGFQRVILARELSLKQLREIRKNTKIELEFFVHGALCVSFSGRCYLSHATQERSANRGECAQPCRLPYTLIDSSGRELARDKYLLSLKDLNLTEHLRKLIDIGISSFKIEGRLKDINYVKNVTAFYRRRIDEILETNSSLRRASSGDTSLHFQPNPSKTFNRGFTDHFIQKRNKNILSLYTPKSVGAFLGNVERIQKGHFILRTNEVLHTGDGICYFDERKVLQGTNINRIEGKKIYPSDISNMKVGMEIYRNYDYVFAKKLQSDSTKRLISVQMRFKEINNGFMLSVEDEDGVKAKVEKIIENIPAKKTSNAKEIAKLQLTKLGGSIFICEKLDILWDRPYFLPVSAYNEIRRDAIASLERERIKCYRRQTAQILPNSEPYPEVNLDYTANVANEKAMAFYRRHGIKKIEPAFELGHKRIEATVMTMKHCLRFQFGLCPGRGNTNGEPLFLLDARNRYRLEFDCKACEMKIVLEKEE